MTCCPTKPLPSKFLEKQAKYAPKNIFDLTLSSTFPFLLKLEVILFCLKYLNKDEKAISDFKDLVIDNKSNMRELLQQKEWVWLVFFIPLVISSGGNSGNQSATLIITALTMGELAVADWWRVVRRELAQGLLLGGFLAAIGYVATLPFAPRVRWPAR